MRDDDPKYSSRERWWIRDFAPDRSWNGDGILSADRVANADVDELMLSENLESSRHWDVLLASCPDDSDSHRFRLF